jgi:hypothetical protein
MCCECLPAAVRAVLVVWLCNSPGGGYWQACRATVGRVGWQLKNDCEPGTYSPSNFMLRSLYAGVWCWKQL